MYLKEAGRKLRDLGLRTPPQVVLEAVQRIRNGESLYKLYSGDYPLVAKGTAKKIKGLLSEGKLSFLWEGKPELEAWTQATEGVAGWELGRIDMRTAEAFEARVEELMSNLPGCDWNIEGLENAGIPLNEALNLLIEKDKLLQVIDTWARPQLKRFLELNYLVAFSSREQGRKHDAPYELIELAAAAYAQGKVDRNPFLMSMGANLLEYQVWRGPQFLEAFNQAQVATSRVVRQSKQRYGKLLTDAAAMTVGTEIAADEV